MTTPTPWTQEAARAGVVELRRLIRFHTPRATHWEGEQLTYCVSCSPTEQQHRLEAVKWPCPPLLEAGLTIRDAGLLHAGEDLGRESTRDEHHQLQQWQSLLMDLDRCPHGRHSGDSCAGWRGPGRFEGGCQGGRSLGNPALTPGRVIGTNLYATVLYIVPISRETRHQIDAWKIEITDGKLLDAYAADTSAGELTCKCPGNCGDSSPHDAHLLPGAADLLAAEGSNGAQLGLATTRALLIELQARGEIGEHLDLRDTVMALFGRLDGETLDYRTVDSE